MSATHLLPVDSRSLSSRVGRTCRFWTSMLPSARFDYTAPAHSLTIFRIHRR